MFRKTIHVALVLLACNLCTQANDYLNAEYGQVLEVPESITKNMTQFTNDMAPIEARRDQIAR